LSDPTADFKRAVTLQLDPSAFSMPAPPPLDGLDLSGEGSESPANGVLPGGRTSSLLATLTADEAETLQVPPSLFRCRKAGERAFGSIVGEDDGRSAVHLVTPSSMKDKDRQMQYGWLEPWIGLPRSPASNFRFLRLQDDNFQDSSKIVKDMLEKLQGANDEEGEIMNEGRLQPVKWSFFRYISASPS
jgi:hypothetical protein